MITSNVFTGHKKYTPLALPNLPFVLTLHQIARAQQVKAEFVKQAKKHAHDRKTSDILSDGVIVGVGLIQRDH